MTANPSPSPLSRSLAGTATSSSRTGALALPRSPIPFQALPTQTPGASRGTKYRVLASGSAASARRVETT